MKRCFVAGLLLGLAIAGAAGLLRRLPREETNREVQPLHTPEMSSTGFACILPPDEPMLALSFETEIGGRRSMMIHSERVDNGRLTWNEDGTVSFYGNVDASAKAFARIVAEQLRTVWPQREEKP